MKRLVFVAPVEVDQPVDGLRWRAHLTARGLRQQGTLEVIEVTTDRGRRGEGIAVCPRTPVRRIISRVHPTKPARVAARDWEPARLVLDRVGQADLVWVMQPDLLGSGLVLPAGPLVVDLVDLEHGKHRGSDLIERHQRARWRALEQHVLGRADAVVLAHPGEAATLDHPRVSVLPNAVDVEPIERSHDGATLTLIGRFTYDPNREAAEWMVGEVLPRIRESRSEVTLRLVGRHEGALDPLAQHDGVRVEGFVTDLDEVWATATATVAPIRSGTGTRLKIIESFARGVPVVSTTLGYDGIDVTPGQHLLAADDPDGFADACLRLLANPSLADDLRSRALDHARQVHTPEAVEQVVGSVAADVMDVES